MQGITTAIVAFIFVCILFPRIVKNRTQFYTAFGLLLVMLFFDSAARIFNNEKFNGFVGGLNGLLQLASLLLLVLSTGGLSLKDLTGEFKSAFEVIRRGESNKEIIVPLTGEMPKPRKTRTDDDEARQRTVHTIDTPVSPPSDPSPAAQKPPESSSIPLE